jgi:hypothetical protein
MAAARGDKEFKANQSTSVGGKKGGGGRERDLNFCYQLKKLFVRWHYKLQRNSIRKSILFL